MKKKLAVSLVMLIAIFITLMLGIQCAPILKWSDLAGESSTDIKIKDNFNNGSASLAVGIDGVIHIAYKEMSYPDYYYAKTDPYNINSVSTQLIYTSTKSVASPSTAPPQILFSKDNVANLVFMESESTQDMLHIPTLFYYINNFFQWRSDTGCTTNFEITSDSEIYDYKFEIDNEDKIICLYSISGGVSSKLQILNMESHVTSDIMDNYTGKSIFKKDINFTLNTGENNYGRNSSISNNKDKEKNNMNSAFKDVVIEYGESGGYSITISEAVIYVKNPTGNTIQMDDNPASSNFIMETNSKQAAINDNDIKQLIDVFYNNRWTSLSSKMDSMDRYDYVWLRLKDAKGDKSVQIGTSEMSGNVIPAEMKTIISYMKSLANKYIK